MRKTRAWRAWLCALWLALGGTSGPLHADALEAIPLEHRLAEDLIPVLQPLMPPGSALTGTGNVLLVRADAATLAQIRTALVTLDRAPRQLLITVGQSTGVDARETGVRGSATIGAGDVQVGINRPPAGPPGAQVAVQDRRTRADVHSVSSVRTLEGSEAWVAVGQSQPYRDAQTGFFATPRVDGDRVVLDISPTQQQLGDRSAHGTVATRSLTTTVAGRLGEWIELGGVADTRSGTDRGLIRWGSRSDLTQYSAWVKVEEVR